MSRQKVHLKYIGSRTKTVEKRILSLLRRRKGFLLTTLSVKDNKTIEEWHASGVPKSLQDYKDLAAIINWGTGRGPNPFAFVKGSGSNKVADLFNVAFFAPRFMGVGISNEPRER